MGFDPASYVVVLIPPISSLDDDIVVPLSGAEVLILGLVGEVLLADHVEEGGPGAGDGGSASPSRQWSLKI